MTYKECVDMTYQSFRSNKICIFGSGMRGNECYRMLAEMEADIVGFFDNDEKKSGRKIGDIYIEKPKYIENVIVIETVLNHYDSLEKQLFELGYPKTAVYTYEDVLSTYIENKDIKPKKEVICEYPHTIQLPITHLCNFDCIMCGMHEMIHEKNFTVNELDYVLKDKLFSQVKAIGINGGEPFMRNDFAECVDVMINNCKYLEAIYIISNGYFTEKIISSLEKISLNCRKNNVKVYLSISVDAIGELQDFHRGKKGSFENADATCRKILERKEELVSGIDIICTITKHNVEYLNEVVVWAEELGIEVAYNIATENERIKNFARVENFSVLKDEHAKMLATEFFYGQYLKTKKEKYYALYLYLRDGKRYAQCPCRSNEWITVTPDAEIGFCATRSKKIGSALEASAYELVKKNIDQLDEIKETYCETCSHYAYRLNADGLRELMMEKYKMENVEW